MSSGEAAVSSGRTSEDASVSLVRHQQGEHTVADVVF